jgi:hypothetical protein
MGVIRNAAIAVLCALLLMSAPLPNKVTAREEVGAPTSQLRVTSASSASLRWTALTRKFTAESQRNAETHRENFRLEHYRGRSLLVNKTEIGLRTTGLIQER